MSNLRDPFNPKTGEFRENIRATVGLDDSELRASLKQFGWRKEFPAYTDERGVTLVGHRRLKIAKEEGIKPVIVQLTLGDGDEADAERLRIALTSNVGSAPMTKQDRQRFAKYLYGEREWTMQRIAEALDVSTKQISRDLSNFDAMSKSKHTKTASNPKGAGRPKGSTSAPKKRSGPQPQRQKNEATKVELAAALVVERDYTYEQAAAEAEVGSVQIVKTGVARAEGRREGREEASMELAQSMTAQQRVDIAIRAAKRKLDQEFELRVLDECKRRLDAISLPHYAKQLEELEHSIRSRKGVMDRLTYRKILACLHIERLIQLLNISITKLDPAIQRRYEEAFRLFTELEKRVLDEKESPTEFRRMPRTYEELMAMKAKVQAERRAKRATGKTAVSVR